MLTAVSPELLHIPMDLRVLDGSHLLAHLNLVWGTLELPGGSCTQEALELCVRCISELVPQMVQQVEEFAEGAHAAAQGHTGFAQIAGLLRCMARTGDLLKYAFPKSSDPHGLLSHNRACTHVCHMGASCLLCA